MRALRVALGMLLWAGCAFELDSVSRPGGGDGPTGDGPAVDASPSDGGGPDGGSGRLRFASPMVLTTGAGPTGIIIAKLVGQDSLVDLATANFDDNTVSIVKQTSQLSFSRGTLTAGSHPIALVTADFNNDSGPDLALVNNGDGTMYVAIQAPSTESFAVVSRTVGAAPRDIGVADVSGDGQPDLFVPNGVSNTVSVFLGNGDGSFQNRTDYLAHNGPTSVVAGLFDGTTRPALAVSHANGDVLIMRAMNTAGVFDGSTTIFVGAGLGAITKGDVNGDTLADLAVLGPGDHVSVLDRIPDPPYLSLPATMLSVAAGPVAVRIADMDGDGKPDIIVASANGLTFYFGGGSTVQNLALANTPARGMDVGDVDGDGKPDLAVTSLAGISLYLQQ